MGRITNRRLRELERRADEAAWRVATTRLSEEDLATLAPWGARVLEADDAGVSRPLPTPDQERALVRWHALREQAYLEGWGRTDRGLGQEYFG